MLKRIAIHNRCRWVKYCWPNFFHRPKCSIQPRPMVEYKRSNRFVLHGQPIPIQPIETKHSFKNHLNSYSNNFFLENSQWLQQQTEISHIQPIKKEWKLKFSYYVQFVCPMCDYDSTCLFDSVRMKLTKNDIVVEVIWIGIWIGSDSCTLASAMCRPYRCWLCLLSCEWMWARRRWCARCRINAICVLHLPRIQWWFWINQTSFLRFVRHYIRLLYVSLCLIRRLISLSSN